MRLFTFLQFKIISFSAYFQFSKDLDTFGSSFSLKLILKSFWLFQVNDTEVSEEMISFYEPDVHLTNMTYAHVQTYSSIVSPFDPEDVSLNPQTPAEVLSMMKSKAGMIKLLPNATYDNKNLTCRELNEVYELYIQQVSQIARIQHQGGSQYITCTSIQCMILKTLSSFTYILYVPLQSLIIKILSCRFLVLKTFYVNRVFGLVIRFDFVSFFQIFYHSALNASSSTAHSRSIKRKSPSITFNDDVISDSILSWATSSLGLEYGDNGALTVTSYAFVVGPDEQRGKMAGTYHCKLISPYRAMEWFYIDSLKRKSYE